MLKETFKKVEREIPREEWEYLWNTRRMGYVWGFYYGILDRRPTEAEFDRHCDEIRNSTDKLATVKAMAMELVKSAEFKNDIRPNYSCEKLVAGFLMAVLNEKCTEYDYDCYMNYCKSHNKNQTACEEMLENLLKTSGFNDRF
jgi:hypothetical protein